MKKLHLNNLSAQQIRPVLRMITHWLGKFQVVLLTLVVFGFLAYTIYEVSQIGSAEPDPEDIQKTELELAQKRIQFDQAIIQEVDQRLDEPIAPVLPAPGGTNNPFNVF